MEALIALISAALGGSISVITLLITNRRDDHRESRASHERQVEATAALYEEALFVLDRNARQSCVATEEFAERAVRVLTSLRLRASSDVLRAYLAAGEALDAWAAEAREAAPKRIAGGLAIISSTDSLHRSKAEGLFPEYAKRFETLEETMRRHLVSLRSA